MSAQLNHGRMNGIEPEGNPVRREGKLEKNSYLCNGARAVRDSEHSRPSGGVLLAVVGDDSRSGAICGIGIDHDNGYVGVPGPCPVVGNDGDGDDRNRCRRHNQAARDVGEDGPLGRRQRHGPKGQESLEQLHGISLR